MSKKLSISEMHELAHSKGGICLSDEYVDVKTPLKWQCSKGHIWDTRPHNVKTGYWCPFCAGNAKGDMKRMHELAKANNGRCLSSQYINNATKLTWQCENGHVFKSTPSNIASGRWCRKCSYIKRGNAKKLGIKHMKELALKNKGKCLSNRYKGVFSDLMWECSMGHKWYASADRIKNQGSWCPICSQGISERICRAIFEKMFCNKFPTLRPKWLKSPIGKQMELDGYCSQLGLAFEYQGEQHYSHSRLLSKKTPLEYRRECDRLKRIQCKENNVILIEVPYSLQYDEIQEFVQKVYIKKSGKTIPHCRPFDYRELNFGPPHKLAKLKKIAISKGGECLSKRYAGANTKHKWKCAKGHTWLATPNKVLNGGRWCPHCYGKIRLTIQDMHELAASRGGRCLSTNYRNARTKLRWQCAEGHQWEAVQSSLKRGTWCPECYRLQRIKKNKTLNNTTNKPDVLKA